MGILRRQTGTIHELAKNPLAAMLAAKAFRGAKVHRGAPLSYSDLKSDSFDELDDLNRQHVEWALEDWARKHRCSVSDLAWALAPQKNAEGLHPVMIQRWEDIEKRDWFRRKADNG